MNQSRSLRLLDQPRRPPSLVSFLYCCRPYGVICPPHDIKGVRDLGDDGSGILCAVLERRARKITTRPVDKKKPIMQWCRGSNLHVVTVLLNEQIDGWQQRGE